MQEFESQCLKSIQFQSVVRNAGSMRPFGVKYAAESITF